MISYHDVLWLPDLQRRYGKERTTLWRWITSGKLPPPSLKIGNRPGWYRRDLERFERDSAAA